MTDQRTGPRPFPFALHPADRFGVHRYTDHGREAAFTCIGQDGWAPIAYVAALSHLRSGAAGALARYLELANAREGLAALEGTHWVDEERRRHWAERLKADEERFGGFRLPADSRTGARRKLASLLFAVCPPNMGFPQVCGRGYVNWWARPEHTQYHEQVLAHYDWVHAQVAKEFSEQGLEVRGPLFRAEGFEPLYHDEWDIYDI